MELSRARCGLEIGSQGPEDKAGGGITGVGGVMSHFRTLKNETGTEQNWVAGAKVTRSWRKGWQSKWNGTSGGIFSEGSGSLPVISWQVHDTSLLEGKGKREKLDPFLLLIPSPFTQVLSLLVPILFPLLPFLLSFPHSSFPLLPSEFREGVACCS